MKLIVASIVLIGTVSATKTGSNVHTKDNNVAGLRGGGMQQKERKAQGMMELFGDDTEEFNLEEFFGGSSPASPQADSDMDGATDGDFMGMGGGMQGGMGDIDTSGGVDSASSFPDIMGMGDHLGGMMGSMVDMSCGDTCAEEDQGVCNAFHMAFLDTTSILKDACEKRCIPKMRLETCKMACDANADEETTTAVSTAVARMGFLDSAVDMMCNDCKFYECCLKDSVLESKYEQCEELLVYDKEDQATGDSILDQISDIMGDLVGGFGGGDNNDTMSDLGLGGLFEDMGLPDVSDLDMGGLLDGFGGSSSVQSDTEEASGLSTLGQLVGGFDCPDTCDESLCNDIMMGTADRSTIGEACNTGCLPVLEQSCDEACGNQNGPADLAMFTDMACKSCEFLTCCAKQVDQVELGPKFDTCQKHLPETSQFLADMVVSAQEWVDNMDLEAIWESMGLNEMFEDLQTIFDDSMANLGSMPDTASCDPNTCPIAGLCEMNIDYASIKPDEICSSDAFYKCGQGLRDMCDQCNEDGGLFCSFCRIATCCEEAGENASFQECALNSPLADVIVQDDAGAAPDEDSVTEVDNSEPLPEDQVKPESPEVETAVEDSIPEPESEFDEIEIVEAAVEETDIDVESSETPEEDTTATAPDDQSANASEDPSAGQVPLTPVQVVSANEYTAAGSYYSVATSMCAVVASVLYIVSF